MNIPVRCITFQNPEKRARITQRFQTVGVDFEFVESPSWNDPKVRLSAEVIDRAIALNRWIAKEYSVIQGHFKAIASFLRTGQEVGVILEDDVMIRKTLAQDLAEASEILLKKDLDLLRLGYLIYGELWLQENIADTRIIARSRGFVYQQDGYPTPGAQMYMINRRHAMAMIDQYGPGTRAAEYFLANPDTRPCYAADNLITQMGQRANIYPMLACEEVQSTLVNRGDLWQEDLHLLCHQFSFDPNIHI